MRDLNWVLCGWSIKGDLQRAEQWHIAHLTKNFKNCPASNTRILSSEPLNIKQENGMIIFCKFLLCHFWSDPWYVLWLIFMKVPATQELSFIPWYLMTIINKVIIIISSTEMTWHLSPQRQRQGLVCQCFLSTNYNAKHTAAFPW